MSNIFLKLFFIYLAFTFFFWMTGELVRTSPWRLLLTLYGPEFANFGGKILKIWLAFLPEKPGWVLIDGRMQG
jgi:hypothetical protein